MMRHGAEERRGYRSTAGDVRLVMGPACSHITAEMIFLLSRVLGFLL